MRENKVYVLLLIISVFLGQFSPVYAQFNIQESFTHRSVNEKVKYGDNAVLTADGKIDDYGKGWLRLTSDKTNQKGYMIIDESFPSTRGVLIEFEYKSWRSRNAGDNRGADGISVFLFDARYNAKTFALGSYGGALGYGPSSERYGVTGGYIAVGLDEYGNFTISS